MSLLQSFKTRDRVFDFIAPAASPVDVRHGPILYMEDVTVSFDGFKAINKLNLTIDDGELRCIIGPNGAGKTTMMDIITGKTRPTEGSVWFGSRHNLLNMNEPEIASLGIVVGVKILRKVLPNGGKCLKSVPWRRLTRLIRSVFFGSCRRACLIAAFSPAIPVPLLTGTHVISNYAVA